MMAKFNYFPYRERSKLEKLSPAEQADLLFDLINAFVLMRTPVDSTLLLQDLFTETEIRNLAKRLRIAKLLISGRGQEEIVHELHCSYATVAKVNIWLANAGQGLRKIIQVLPKRRKVWRPRKIPGIGYGLPQILLHYASLGLKGKEKKMLEDTLEQLREKSAVDRDFKEEVNLTFQERKSRKH